MRLEVRKIALICLALVLALTSEAQSPKASGSPIVQSGYSISLIDLASQKDRQTVVDRETGQYPGHPTTEIPSCAIESERFRCDGIPAHEDGCDSPVIVGKPSSGLRDPGEEFAAARRSQRFGGNRLESHSVMRSR
jgi:hypothetical protein